MFAVSYTITERNGETLRKTLYQLEPVENYEDAKAAVLEMVVIARDAGDSVCWGAKEIMAVSKDHRISCHWKITEVWR